MTRYRSLLVILFAVSLAPVVRAEEKPQLTLGKAVPSNVFIYVAVAHNPENEYLYKYWGEVGKAFKESGVIEDVHTLIGSVAPDPAANEKFEHFWKRAGELIDGVDWEARVNEFVYACRMSAPMPEYLILLRYVDEAKAAQNADAFAAVLKEIESAANGASAADEATASAPANNVTFVETKAHGATIRSLSFKQVPFINLRVAVRGPVVAISADRTMLDECLSMLAGEGDKKGLTQTERYTQAMSKVPPAEDAAVFFDIKAMLDGLRELTKFVADQAPKNASPNATSNAQQAIDVVNKIIDEFAMLDYMAATTQTDGYRQVGESVLVLGENASKSRLYNVFCKPAPVEKFDRFIPKEATSYWVTSGVDWSALYGAVLDFIGKDVPDGQNLLTQWEEAQTTIGFHPQSDLFDWLGAQIVSVTLPAATPTPFGSDDTVLLISVRNEKQAAEKVKAGLDKLNQVMTQAQQPLTSQPADIPGVEGFRSITHPMVAMFLRPVYGVAEGYLIIGSSPDAVANCLATGRGEHPSVAKNERVVREGLIPKGPVSSASFQDLTTLGKTMAQVFNGISMVSAFIPDQPDTRPIRGIFGILGKLAPVAMKLDFFVSQSTMTTFEKNTWHIHSVTNYRPPAATTAPEESTTPIAP